MPQPDFFNSKADEEPYCCTKCRRSLFNSAETCDTLSESKELHTDENTDNCALVFENFGAQVI